MRDPRITQAREDVETTERRWGAIGPHRRDAAAADYKSGIAACDASALLLRPSTRAQRSADQEWQALMEQVTHHILDEGLSSVLADRSVGNLLRHRTDAKSNGVVTAGSIKRHAVGAITLIRGSVGTGKSLTIAALVKDLARGGESGRHIVLKITPPGPSTGPAEPGRHLAAKSWRDLSSAQADVPSTEAPDIGPLIERFLTETSVEAQISLFELAWRLRLVEATPFHVLRQRDGASAVPPVPEDEPGVDSQVVVMAPIAPNAPPGWGGGLLEMDGYLAA